MSGVKELLAVKAATRRTLGRALNLPVRLSAFSALVALAALGTVLAASCATVQDDRLVSVDDRTAADRLASLEEDVVRIDASVAPGRDAAIASAMERVDALERLNVSDTVFQARLAAWSGRLYLAAGKRGEATKRHDQALSLLASDVPTAILGARLEKAPDKAFMAMESALAVDPGDPRLLVERALYSEKLGRYAEAVAAFDAALPQLPAYYRETYTAARDRAWSLRDAQAGEDKSIADILAKPAISWQDAIEYAAVKTSLLDFVTAGKTTSPQKLFPRLVESSLVPARDTGVYPGPADPMTRAETAWFAWHVLAERRADRGILTKYSKRWSAVAGLGSPIADVPVASPYFDSVMGCVEGEIMALPDGKNFRPEGPVTGGDFARVLGNLPD